MTQRWRRLAPALAAGGFLLALAGQLLDPRVALAARDVLQFHWPLRATLLRLAAAGLPEWNPWISGGQPLLSDPSYTAFYPLTWLALLAGPLHSLALGVALHLGLAAWGAFSLARRLGTRASVASFAAIAWTGSGVLLSFVHALTLLPSAAWLPWTLVATHALVAATDARAARRALAGLAAVLALVLLAGEPVSALCNGVAAACFALGFGRRPAARALTGLAGATALAAALAAAQLVPALDRLADSRRAGGLAPAAALEWSLPPARALELVWPGAFGAPLRHAEGLWLGWSVHDRDFPYVVSVYPGLLVLILAAVALARRDLPARLGWLTMFGLGVALALGRHTPLFGLLHRFVPPFSVLRYPEKFVLLAAAALAFSAALCLEQLLRELEAGRPRAARLPLWIALGALGLALVAAGAAWQAPPWLTAWIADHAGPTATAAGRDAALGWLRRDATLTLAVATATVLGLAWLVRRRPRSAAVAAVAVALLAGDLLLRHRALVATVPAACFAEPPLARQLRGEPGRVWAAYSFDRAAELVPRSDDPLAGEIRWRVARLDPWVGAVWGLRTALTTDYALSFTAPLRRAVDATRRQVAAGDAVRLNRLLGAWAVRHALLRRPPEELAAELDAGRPAPAPVRLAGVPGALAIARCVAAARNHANGDVALDAALGDGPGLDRLEQVVGAPWSGERAFDPRARVVAFAERGDAVEVEVRADGEALLVVAVTWDRFWRAAVDGLEATALETGAGYLAVPLRAGARQVRLEHRNPWTRVGAAISSVALAAALLLVRRSRRDSPREAGPG